MAETQTAYCMSCREKVDVEDPKQVEMKNGRPAVKGTCSECGGGTYKIGKMK